jgi:hypothetical protein
MAPVDSFDGLAVRRTANRGDYTLADRPEAVPSLGDREARPHLKPGELLRRPRETLEIVWNCLAQTLSVFGMGI